MKISKELSIKHYSATELISRLKSENVASDKRVNNVSENQNLIFFTIKKYLKCEEYYLFDGNFCLLNSEREIIKITIQTFRALGLAAIIVLVDEEENILKKLVNGDKKMFQISLLKEFQQKEILYAQEVAKYIAVECKIVNVNFDIDEMSVLINNFLDAKTQQ